MNRISSQRKLDKYHRRRILYGSMYAEMTEAIDINVESEINGDEQEIESTQHDNNDNNDNEHEQQYEQGTESFPQLIAQVSTDPATTTTTTTTPATTQSEGSVAGSVGGKYKQLADALYLEAQEVQNFYILLYTIIFQLIIIY